MTFESSNTKMLEKMTTEQVIKTVRNAMKAGCITPCHAYDAVDELICRLSRHERIREEGLKNKGKSPKKANDCYYEFANTTTSMADVMKRIRKEQGETFFVRVRFGFVDANGNRMVDSGVITGVLDNGDEVYIDAETIEYMEATKKYIAEQKKEKGESK